MLNDQEKMDIQCRMDQVILDTGEEQWEYPGAKHDLTEAVLWTLDPQGTWPQEKVAEAVELVGRLL